MVSPQMAAGCLTLIFLLKMSSISCMTTLPPLTDDPDEAREIAREAYLFFVPVVANWRYLSLTTADPRPQTFIGFNSFRHADAPREPNDNVIYSQAWLDLRQEPMVVAVPQIQGRYYSLHIIDGYTHNIGIVSERTTSIGSGGGRFIVAGPGQCSAPATCAQPHDNLFCSEGDFVAMIIRIQFFNQVDIEFDIMQIQQRFGIERLSTFCNIAGPEPFPYPVPFNIPGDALPTLVFFEFANLIMLNLTVHPLEESLFRSFAKIGVIPGEQFPPQDLSERVLEEIQNGIDEAITLIAIEIDDPSTGDESEGWTVVVNPPQFGNRSVMQGRYLTRATATRSGLYGLDREEAFYPNTNETPFGFTLDASANNSYYIYFSRRDMPPVFGFTSHTHSHTSSLSHTHSHADTIINMHTNTDTDTNTDTNTDTHSLMGFWSITMQDATTGQFVPNPFNRFSIGSHELDILCRYRDDSFPIIIQKNKPTDPAFLRNWLPAPDGEFILLARLYLPTPEAIHRPYLPPGVHTGLPPISPHFCPRLF